MALNDGHNAMAPQANSLSPVVKTPTPSRGHIFFQYLMSYSQSKNIMFDIDALLGSEHDILRWQLDKDHLGLLKDAHRLLTTAEGELGRETCKLEPSTQPTVPVLSTQYATSSHAFRLILYMLVLVRGSSGNIPFRMSALLANSSCTKRIRKQHRGISYVDLLKDCRNFLLSSSDALDRKVKQLEQEELSRPKQVPVAITPVRPRSTRNTEPVNAMSESEIWAKLIDQAHRPCYGTVRFNQRSYIAQIPQPSPSRPCWITKLTNETMLRIVTFAYLEELNDGYHGETEPTASIHLSLAKVNRRFGTIVDETPLFWGRISSTMDERTILRNIERSGSAPLTVTVWYTEGCSGSPIRKVLALASRLTPRWKTFIFGMFYNDYGSNAAVLKSVATSFPKLELPALETLYLCFEEIGMFDPYDGEIEPLSSFYKSWDMPNLRCITAINTVPQFKVAPPLVSLDVTLKTLEQEGEYRLKPLATLLLDCPLLETLRLEFRSFDVADDEQDVPGFKGVSVILPKLTEFEFSYDAPRSDSLSALQNQFLHVMDTLELPSLRKAIVNVECDEFKTIPTTGDSSLNFVRRTVRPFEKSSALLELEMGLNVTFEQPLEESPLHTLLGRLTHLQTLRIGGSRGFTPYASGSAPGTNTMPPLQTLILQGCGSIDVPLLRDVIQRVKGSCHGEKLKEFVIQGSSTLKKDKVEDIVGDCGSGVKLVWNVGSER